MFFFKLNQKQIFLKIPGKLKSIIYDYTVFFNISLYTFYIKYILDIAGTLQSNYKKFNKIIFKI